MDEAWRERLNRIFGTGDWESAFYQRKETRTLFGDDKSVEKIATFDRIKEFVLGRLRGEFADAAPNPLVLENSRHAPLFVLFFAVGNERGAPVAIKIAQHILRG